jgi:hypothetical protein
LSWAAFATTLLPEYGAMLRAINKLEIFGVKLPFPWTSHVQGTDLWELRPLRGRSRWRAIYRRQGDVLRIAAIGPEAKVDQRGFNAAVQRAVTRLGSQ